MAGFARPCPLRLLRHLVVTTLAPGEIFSPLSLPPTGAARSAGGNLSKPSGVGNPSAGAHETCEASPKCPFGIFSSEKANAAELDRWDCVAQPPSCHEEPGSQKKKKGRRIPPRLRYASPPPVGGKTVSEPRDFSGGAGGSAPSHGAGDAVASPRRNSPLREKAPQGHFSVLTARISGFLRPDGPRQRPGVFRASGNVLRARINSFERNYLRLVLFDGLFSCLDAVSNAASKAEGRTDHVRVGSA